MNNGYKTYSKTSFKEGKHKRKADGSFGSKDHTEEQDVSYHHKFTRSKHPTAKDGTFVSNGVLLGIRRYGSSKS